jgi:hypothetical protein
MGYAREVFQAARTPLTLSPRPQLPIPHRPYRLITYPAMLVPPHVAMYRMAATISLYSHPNSLRRAVRPGVHLLLVEPSVLFGWAVANQHEVLGAPQAP